MSRLPFWLRYLGSILDLLCNVRPIPSLLWILFFSPNSTKNFKLKSRKCLLWSPCYVCGGVSLSALGKLRRTEHGPSPPQHYTLVTRHMHVVGQVNRDPSHHPPTLKKGRVLITMGKGWRFRNSINQTTEVGKWQEHVGTVGSTVG